jgi:U3 small nucleolar RNA-associated protein MPP10
MLAPEEVFTAPSDLRSRDELTPVEKRAHRNKQRKARKKTKDHLATTVDKFARTQKGKRTAGAVKREKEKALKSVVKTGRGVTVVGKQGAESQRHSKAKPAVTMDGKKLKL